MDVEPEIKPFIQGAYAGVCLSFGMEGKVLWGNAVAANRTREIRPSGMRGGLAETQIMDKTAKFTPKSLVRRISTRQQNKNEMGE